MKNAICITDDASKGFHVQQVMRSLGFRTYLVSGIDSLFGCIDVMVIDIIIVSELKTAKISPFSTIKAIRQYVRSPKALAVIHLWSRITSAEPGAMGGPIATVIEPLTLESAKNALGLLQLNMPH
jgi:hypothetical protein